MKRLVTVSFITILAVLPMVASAEVFSVADPTTDANAAVAETNPKWALAEAGDNDDNLATAGYVKGAYNQTMKAINKVATTVGNTVQGVKVNGTELSKDANGKVDVLVSEGSTNGTISVNNADVAVHGLGSAAFTPSTNYATSAQGTTAETAAQNIGTMANLTGNETTLVEAIEAVRTTANGALVASDIAEGATNGTISVNNTDIAVHGLGSAAFSETTAFDAAGTASGVQAAIEGKLDDGANGYDIDAKTLKVQGASVLTGAALTDYAKKSGVENTIETATITARVPTLTTWGNDNSTGTVGVEVVSIAATYSEPAPAPVQE